MNSTTVGRTISLASRRPPIMFGLTVAFAPARIILGAASGAITFVTMRAFALRLRADSVTNLRSADESYMGSVTLTITDADHIEEEWTSYKDGKEEPHASFKYTRKK